MTQLRRKQSPKLGRGVVALSLLACACTTSAIRPAGSTLHENDGESQARSGSHAKKQAIKAPRGEPVSFEKQFARVSKLRGLKILGPISGLSVEPRELVRHVEQSVSIQTPPEALTGTEEMLVALDVAPVDFDFRATMLDLLGENLQGLYDPHLKMMLVRSDQDENREVTLAHELVHALQDQHFDLKEIIEFEADDTDRSSALSCLAEGDATSAMFDAVLPQGQTALDLPPGFIQKQFSSLRSPAQNSAPSIVVRSLAAPYLDGVEFVHQLRKRGGFPEVDRVFRNPPASTEQVLHLDKYDQAEAPLAVELPRAPQPGFQLSFHDVWGEQSLRLLLEEWMSPEKAKIAAAGWGGDRISLFSSVDETSDKQIMVHWHIAADSNRDAAELFEAIKAALTHDVSGDKESHCGRRGETSSQVLALKVRERDVFLGSAAITRKSGISGDCAQALGWLQTQAHNKDPRGN